MRSNQKAAAFIAALTATDALTKTERARATAEMRSYRRDRLYECRMHATAAYHLAEAAGTRACLARVTHQPDAKDATARHDLAVGYLIACVHDFVEVPFASNNDRKERAALIRKWGKASFTIATSDMWLQAKADWLALLAEDA